MATHISRHLHFAGHTISCIYSRSRESAVKLASEFGSIGTNISAEVPKNADYYIIAIPDDMIEDVILKFKDCEGIWLHTAGAISVEVFKEYQSRYGVFYPLQTLNSDRSVLLEDTPILVEGSSPGVLESIHLLAASISQNIHEIDSSSRLTIHLSAVFANNFSNHMVHLAQKLLEDQGIDGKLLIPILKETFSKLEEFNAIDAQTGPAFRGDQKTLQKHLELLKDKPELKNLYTFISRSIDSTRD